MAWIQYVWRGFLVGLPQELVMVQMEPPPSMQFDHLWQDIGGEG